MPHSKRIAPYFWFRLALAAGVILLVAVALRAQQADEAKPSSPASGDSQQAALSGSWKLNPDESDNPREKLKSAVQDREQSGYPGGPGRRGGMGGGGIGFPGSGPIGGPMGGPMGGPTGYPRQGQSSGSEDQKAKLLQVVEPPGQISIAQKGPEIDMTDSESHTRELFTDGRKLDKAKKDAIQIPVKAHWQGQTLVTEEKGPNGEKVSHTYELSPEGKFIDTLTVESKKLSTPIIVRSVYDKS